MQVSIDCSESIKRGVTSTRDEMLITLRLLRLLSLDSTLERLIQSLRVDLLTAAELTTSQ